MKRISKASKDNALEILTAQALFLPCRIRKRILVKGYEKGYVKGYEKGYEKGYAKG